MGVFARVIRLAHSFAIHSIGGSCGGFDFLTNPQKSAHFMHPGYILGCRMERRRFQASGSKTSAFSGFLGFVILAKMGRALASVMTLPNEVTAFVISATLPVSS